jgi:anti-sigma B factor antagonist
MMSAAAPLAVRIRHETPQAVVVEAVGELDLATSARLRSALRGVLGIRTVVLDAADIGFCDIAGLRTLIEAQRLAEAAGCSFRLAAPSEAVLRVLELTDTFALFELYFDIESALSL